MEKLTEHIIDEWLVLKCQTGDEKAFSLLVKRWHPKLTMQAYRHTQNIEAARDIAQESWHAFIRGLNNLHDPAAFRVWIYRIVSRRSVDWIRKVTRERKVLNSIEAREELNPVSIEPGSTLLQQLKETLKILPNNQRIILSMFYLDSIKVREMAAILSIPEGTVKSRLFHAREHLKSIYKQYNYENE